MVEIFICSVYLGEVRSFIFANLTQSHSYLTCCAVFSVLKYISKHATQMCMLWLWNTKGSTGIPQRFQISTIKQYFNKERPIIIFCWFAAHIKVMFKLYCSLLSVS